MSEIASKVQKIIVDKLGVEESEVVPTASSKKNSVSLFQMIRQKRSRL